jgi:hypothetical protein
LDEEERFDEEKPRLASYAKAKEIAQQVSAEGGAVQERVLPAVQEVSTDTDEAPE